MTGGIPAARVPALADGLLSLSALAAWRTAEAGHDRLREELREAEGRNRDPSAAVIDSQVVKTTPVGGPERAYDGAKRIAGASATS